RVSLLTSAATRGEVHGERASASNFLDAHWGLGLGHFAFGIPHSAFDQSLLTSAPTRIHGLRGGVGVLEDVPNAGRKARSTALLRSVETTCASRHSQRMISGKMAPPCFCP